MAHQIRPFLSRDWGDVARIYTLGLETGIATFQTQCPSYDEWDKGHLTSPRLVLTLSEAIVGFAALSKTSDRAVYRGVCEVSIYIDPAFCGRGLGKALLSALICASERHDIWTLQSAIIAQNEASIRLHAACGFRTVGYRERIAQNLHGVWCNTVLMERRSAVV